MIREVDFEVESNCYAPPLGAEGPTDETCGNDATTFVKTRGGYRKYICDDHADEVDRFDIPLDGHPITVLCEACQRITPVEKADVEGRCVECQI